jgi:hypothetical protein
MTHTLTIFRHASADSWTVTLDDERENLIDSQAGADLYMLVRSLTGRVVVREKLDERVSERRGE